MMMKKIVSIIFLVCSTALQVQAVVVTLDVFANEHGAVVINLGDMHQHFPATIIEEFEAIADTLLNVQHDIELILEKRDLSDNLPYEKTKLAYEIAEIMIAYQCDEHAIIKKESSSLVLMCIPKFALDFYNTEHSVKPLDDSWFSIPKKFVDIRNWIENVWAFLRLKKYYFYQKQVDDMTKAAVNALLNKSDDASFDLNDSIAAIYNKMLEELTFNYLNQIIIQMESSIGEESSISQEMSFVLLRQIEVSRMTTEAAASLMIECFNRLEKMQDKQQFYKYLALLEFFTVPLLGNLVQVNAFLQVSKKQATAAKSIVFLGAAHIRELGDFWYDVPEAVHAFDINVSSKSIEQLALACRNYYEPGLNDLLSLNGYTKLASYNLLASAFDDQTKEFTLEGCRKVIAQLKEKLSYWVNLPTEEIIQLVKADQEKEMLARARAREQRKVYKKYREQRYKSPEFIEEKRLEYLYSERDAQFSKF